jgi:hypothetical protein
MRIILPYLLLTIFFAVSGISAAHAQDILRQDDTPVSREMANAEFAKCVQDGLPPLNDKELEEFCACRAANLIQFMTREDMGVINDKSQIGMSTKNKYYTLVLGTCLNTPVRVYAYQECMRDRALDGVLEDKNAFCKCVERDMNYYSYLYAPDLLSVIYEKNIAAGDPLYSFVQSSEFRSEHQKVRKECSAKILKQEAEDTDPFVGLIYPDEIR